MHLLFVCTGNTCRSPMAAAMAQAKIAELGLPWSASSAGLSAVDGLPMSTHSAQALTRRHIPLSGHQSTLVRSKMVDKADLILCMTGSHATELKRRFPEASDKVRCLGTYVSDSDIADPFGGSDEAYERAAHDIETALDALFTELQASGGQSAGRNNRDGHSEGRRKNGIDKPDDRNSGDRNSDDGSSSDKGGTES